MERIFLKEACDWMAKFYNFDATVGFSTLEDTKAGSHLSKRLIFGLSWGESLFFHSRWLHLSESSNSFIVVDLNEKRQKFLMPNVNLSHAKRSRERKVKT